MKISYGPEAFFQKYGGVSKYFLRIADGLAKKGHEVEIFSPFFVTQGLEQISHARFEGEPVTFDSKLSRSALRTLSTIKGRSKIRIRRPDIFHPTYYSLMDLVPTAAKTIVTVYDFVHERVGGRNFIDIELTKLRKRTTINRADLILAISESTRADLLEFFPGIDPGKVVVTHLGVDSEFFFHRTSEPTEGRRSILWVGQRGGYKNFAVVISALSLLPKSILHDVDLVLFGGEPLGDETFGALVKIGLKPTQISHVFGDDSELIKRYRTSHMMLYTSLYEGFGLPILESMASGCPVICGAVSSMPEVAGDSALIVDVTKPEEVAIAIQALFDDSELHQQYQKLGYHRASLFPWDACVEKTESAYLRCLE